MPGFVHSAQDLPSFISIKHFAFPIAEADHNLPSTLIHSDALNCHFELSQVLRAPPGLAGAPQDHKSLVAAAQQVLVPGQGPDTGPVPSQGLPEVLPLVPGPHLDQAVRPGGGELDRRLIGREQGVASRTPADLQGAVVVGVEAGRGPLFVRVEKEN